MTTITDITDTLPDMPAGVRIYTNGPGAWARIESRVDVAASTPVATTVRIVGCPCDDKGNPVDGAEHPERLLIINAGSSVTVADALAEIHQALADEIRIAADHRAQVAALASIAG